LQDLLDDREVLPASGLERPEGDKWEITVEHVSFCYPGSTREVLRDISFSTKPGECVAIVGRNGAGKSTLIELLLRFYDPRAGRIVVGGVDLRQWDLEAWRRAMGVMTQDVFLFHSTIADNIAYGRLGATREEIERATQESGADRVIRRLPHGFETVVGDRGMKLSGGERQLIALARLFLRNPLVLLLDEPTSHLDGEALEAVGSALERLMAGRTAFLVAHRPETVRLAPRILLLDGGCLVADGTHETLLDTNPLYRTLLVEMTKTP
jgi:ABC-type multidrug transport system fused ATPase/permease subunit